MSLKDLLAAATPGPWTVSHHVNKEHPWIEPAEGYGEPYMSVSGLCSAETAALIARAPDMAAALIEAEKALAKIVDAAFYDNGDVTYDCNAMSMAYFAARAALAEIREVM